MENKDQQDKLAQVLKYGRCSCGNPAEDSHTCPYNDEIHPDDTSECNCCDKCSSKCAMDINSVDSIYKS